MDAVSVLLGLDPAAGEKKAEGMAENFATIQKRAARLCSMSYTDGDRKASSTSAGSLAISLPDPQGAGWRVGLRHGGGPRGNHQSPGRRERVSHRHGSSLCRGPARLQSADHDSDGVLEFAQRLISSEDKTDGLYWPAETQGDGRARLGAPSTRPQLRQGEPARDIRISVPHPEAARAITWRAGARLRRQRQHDRGFGLVAWPAKYGETGVHTSSSTRQASSTRRISDRIPPRSCPASSASILTNRGMWSRTDICTWR